MTLSIQNTLNKAEFRSNQLSNIKRQANVNFKSKDDDFFTIMTNPAAAAAWAGVIGGYSFSAMIGGRGLITAANEMFNHNFDFSHHYAVMAATAFFFGLGFVCQRIFKHDGRFSN